MRLPGLEKHPFNGVAQWGKQHSGTTNISSRSCETLEGVVRDGGLKGECGHSLLCRDEACTIDVPVLAYFSLSRQPVSLSQSTG